MYFEIDLETVWNKDGLTLNAEISPNSYLLDPSLFQLRGGFGLGIWSDGDFVLTVGGFHPAFVEPEKYKTAFPGLSRLELDAKLGVFDLSVQCFFACTNQAIMAGASVSISGDLGIVSAGLDVYVNVLMTWSPFYLIADLGVTVWFEFCGRHELGVELSIWTPDFGGHAHVSILFVSFDFDFGARRITARAFSRSASSLPSS